VSRYFCAAIVGISIVCAGLAHAGGFVIGRYSGEFLSLGAGARALAMGGAAVANPAPAASSYYNPSALAGFRGGEVEFMHASQFDNLFTYDYLALAKTMPNGLTGGITALYTRVGDIPETRKADPNQPLSDANRVLVSRTTSDNELALIASVGKVAAHGWRVGGNAKLLYKSVARESAYGLGFDVGVGRTFGSALNVGMVARDLTSSVLAWSTGRTEAILPSIAVGGSWNRSVSALNARIGVAADLDGHFESRGQAELVSAGPLSVEPRVGAEYIIANTVALRGGMNGRQPAFGAGLRLAMVNVNAAFQNHTDLGWTNRVSMAVNW
jgi:hypothetical protein